MRLPQGLCAPQVVAHQRVPIHANAVRSGYVCDAQFLSHHKLRQVWYEHTRIDRSPIHCRNLHFRAPHVPLQERVETLRKVIDVHNEMIARQAVQGHRVGLHESPTTDYHSGEHLAKVRNEPDARLAQSLAQLCVDHRQDRCEICVMYLARNAVHHIIWQIG